MHRYLAVAAALVVAGCATTSNTTSMAQKPVEEKEYRVGSRIPVRDPGAISASPGTSVDGSAVRNGGTRTN